MHFLVFALLTYGFNFLIECCEFCKRNCRLCNLLLQAVAIFRDDQINRNTKKPESYWWNNVHYLDNRIFWIQRRGEDAHSAFTDNHRILCENVRGYLASR